MVQQPACWKLEADGFVADIINLGRGKKRYELSPRAKGRANRINHALSHMEAKTLPSIKKNSLPGSTM